MRNRVNGAIAIRWFSLAAPTAIGSKSLDIMMNPNKVERKSVCCETHTVSCQDSLLQSDEVDKHGHLRRKWLEKTTIIITISPRMIEGR
jgi:hypothetical protein